MDIDELLSELDFKPLVLTPLDENDEPIRDPANEREEVAARAKSAELAMKHGLVMSEPTDEQKNKSHTVFAGAADMDTVAQTPELILHLGQMLREYDYQVIEHSKQIRNYITNRLMVESQDQDPRIRLRALEMLGKVSDVGLFTEKSEVKMVGGSSSDVKDQLRARLERMMGTAEVVDVEAENE